LPIPVVIAPPGWDGQPLSQAYTGEGTMVNYGPLRRPAQHRGVGTDRGRHRGAGIGERRINYRLRDWLLSASATGALRSDRLL